MECNANGEIFETFNCGNRLTEPFSIVYIILSMCMIKPEKKGLVSGHRSASKSVW